MLYPGQRVGDYEVVGLLGDGGMGAVYEALQISLQRTVALKVIDQRLSSDEGFRERFRREGQIQARLEHPNIVPVYQAGEAPEGLFLAMRIIRGTTLKEIIRSNSLTDQETVGLLAPIADALDVAHADELIHRDVKPQNILVDEDGRPFLADFGLTKSTSSAGLTRTGQFVGTFDYVSPEQVMGEESGPGSDIYSLAAVLFECLAGAPPFVRSNDAALLYAHVHEEAPDLRKLRPDLGKPAAKVLRTGLAKDPERRYASATELMDAVEQAIGSQPGRPPAREDSPLPTGERDTDTSPPRPERDSPTSPESVPGPEPQPQEKTAADSPDPAPPASESAGGERSGTGTEAEADLGHGPAEEIPQETEGVTAASSVEAAVPDRVPPSPEVREAQSVFARRRQRAIAGGASLLALLGLVVGLLFSGALGSGEASGSALARSSSASIRPPGQWKQVPGSQVQRGTGAGISDPGGLATTSGDPVELAVGTSPGAGNRFLLSTALQKLVPRGQLRPETFEVAGNQAFRYRFVKLGSQAGPFVMFAIPTSRGVVTLMCRPTARGGGAPLSAPAVAQRCGQAAQTLRLEKGAVGEPLVADKDYAASLNGVTGSLNRQVSRGTASLRRASKATGQAAAARSISRAYGLAARRSAGLDAPQRARAANSGFTTSLRRASAAYSSLASAASAESAGAYSSARGSIRRARETLRLSLREFRGLGYRVAG